MSCIMEDNRKFETRSKHKALYNPSKTVYRRFADGVTMYLLEEQNIGLVHRFVRFSS
jgi:hypothetical protein